MIHCHNNQHICLLPELIYFNGFKTVFKFANLFFYSFSPFSQECTPNYHVLCLFIAKKRVNMCYVTYLPAFCKDLISYLPEIESFLPCLFTIEGFPLYSISPLPLAFASNCLEA